MPAKFRIKVYLIEKFANRFSFRFFYTKKIVYVELKKMPKLGNELQDMDQPNSLLYLSQLNHVTCTKSIECVSLTPSSWNEEANAIISIIVRLSPVI